MYPVAISVIKQSSLQNPNIDKSSLITALQIPNQKEQSLYIAAIFDGLVSQGIYGLHHHSDHTVWCNDDENLPLNDYHYVEKSTFAKLFQPFENHQNFPNQSVPVPVKVTVPVPVVGSISSHGINDDSLTHKFGLESFENEWMLDNSDESMWLPLKVKLPVQSLLVLEDEQIEYHQHHDQPKNHQTKNRLEKLNKNHHHLTSLRRTTANQVPTAQSQSLLVTPIATAAKKLTNDHRHDEAEILPTPPKFLKLNNSNGQVSDSQTTAIVSTSSYSSTPSPTSINLVSTQSTPVLPNLIPRNNNYSTITMPQAFTNANYHHQSDEKTQKLFGYDEHSHEEWINLTSNGYCGHCSYLKKRVVTQHHAGASTCPQKWTEKECYTCRIVHNNDSASAMIVSQHSTTVNHVQRTSSLCPLKANDTPVANSCSLCWTPNKQHPKHQDPSQPNIGRSCSSMDKRSQPQLLCLLFINQMHWLSRLPFVLNTGTAFPTFSAYKQWCCQLATLQSPLTNGQKVALTWVSQQN